MYIDVFIKGIPYGQLKVRGNLAAPDNWSETIILNTRDLPKIKGPCIAFVIFVLPIEKFPSDHPFGPDLDNLLKRLLDALGETILSEVKGKDGAIVQINAIKRKASQNEATGAGLTIMEMRDYLTD